MQAIFFKNYVAYKIVAYKSCFMNVHNELLFYDVIVMEAIQVSQQCFKPQDTYYIPMYINPLSAFVKDTKYCLYMAIK